MKKRNIVVVVCVMVIIAITAFTMKQTNSIKGTVTPGDKAIKVVAIPSGSRSDKDSVIAPVANGSFEIQNLKPGDYDVVVEAQEPYGNTLKTGVTVEKGKTTDMGEIQLQQK
jgi:ABC-type Na+ efflux pump permease subunit